MRKIVLSLLICLLFQPVLFAQNSTSSGYSYRSNENPFYWKNRKPHPEYWQQDVHYTIEATLDEKLNIIDGSERLEYTNNSQDELQFVYFHLYQNAFQPGSYADNLMLNNGVKTQWSAYEAQKLGTTISKLEQNGVKLKTELDNTILKVYLNTPLKPGETTLFEIDFVTHFGEGSTRRRMKKFASFGSTAFNGTHWYPRISVYDRKFGWDTQQHLGREFYGDFGAFDVSLNFASNYIVEATGVLQNRDEVLPDSLRQKLDIKNFAHKPWNSKPSVIIPYQASQRKIWKYKAMNVHDFAFTANPNYRIGEKIWNGVQVIAMVQEPHAALWQNAAEYAAKIIQVNSTDFGMFAYPKLVVADAEDGMEYPMLTLDGGYDPSYRQLLAHEIGHNWFFAMVGNNETYRPALDEGFTQFLTAWALEKIDGKYLVAFPPQSKYEKKYKRPTEARYERVYKSFIKDALKNETQQLNTHSDDFNGALGQGGGYKEVYYKTAAMLYNLQYVLGDSLFLKAMQHYVNQWQIAHPYFEDFRNSIIDFTKVDLNWFFDEWLETTKTIDYAVSSVKKIGHNGTYTIRFTRKEQAQMPLDFRVISKKNTVYDFHIPNTWFQKKTDAVILPKWYGWGAKLNPEYTAKVNIPEGIKDVQIDPSHRLADFNLLNNSKRWPLKMRFDHQLENDPLWEKYELFWRPEVWYNSYDGIKEGIHLNGNYLKQRHIFDATLWSNSGIGQQKFTNFQNDFNLYSFRVNYKTALRNVGKKINLLASAKYLDGLQSFKLGFEKFKTSERTRFYLYFKTLYRADSSDLNYLLYPNEWQVSKHNNSFNLGVDHTYYYPKGNGKINLNIRNAAFTKSYTYSSVSLTVVNKINFDRVDFRTRFFMQYTVGKTLPDESALYLAGTNPEELMENKYTRSGGFVPQDWLGYNTTLNHFQQAGGLNLRGYAGYTPVEFTNQNLNQHKIYKGKSGAAINVEMSVVRLFQTRYAKIKNYLAMDVYLFSDAGSLDYMSDAGKLAFAKVRADAGLGATLTVKKWGILAKPAPLTIRFDMPFFLSNPPNEQPEFMKFRWIMGISKSF